MLTLRLPLTDDVAAAGWLLLPGRLMLPGRRRRSLVLTLQIEGSCKQYSSLDSGHLTIVVCKTVTRSTPRQVPFGRGKSTKIPISIASHAGSTICYNIIKFRNKIVWFLC